MVMSGNLIIRNSVKKIFLFTIFSVWSLSSFAQEKQPVNTLSFNYGMGHISRQDLVFSPMVHSDVSFMIAGLEYTRMANLFQNIKLKYSNYTPMVTAPYEFSELGESKTAGPHYFTFVNLEYLIGKQIHESERATTIIGAGISADVQLLNYVYGRIGSFGYYSAFGMNVFVRQNYKINERSQVAGTLSLPLFAWLARSPYLVNDDEFIENIISHSNLKTLGAFIADGELVTWNSWQSIDFEGKYTYDLSGRWELGAAYLFKFIHASEPRNLISLQNTLVFSANFKF
jgi:hypothetical protein